MFWEESTVQTERKQSPIENHLEWKSKLSQFEMYVKDMQQKVTLLPNTFILLDDRFTVKGWDDKANSGIWSNSIKRLDQEELKIYSKNGLLYEGLYNREKIESFGGKAYKELIVLEWGLVNSYEFKGAAMFQVNESLKTIDTNNYVVEYDGVENKKKGSVSYSVPLWKQGKEITKEERNEAIAKVEILKEYFN